MTKKAFNEKSVNDRRTIKAWVTELSKHKIIGEKVKEGYNKASGEPDYTLDKWFIEFLDIYLRTNEKKLIQDHLQKFKDRNGFIIGKLMRACWVDVKIGIAEVAYKVIYNDY